MSAIRRRNGRALRGLAVLLGALVAAVPAAGALAPRAAHAQKGSVLARARAAYERGLELFNQGRYAEAEASFMQAHALRPAPGLLYAAALAAHKGGRADRARALLRRYFRRPPPLTTHAEEISKARELLAEIERKLPGYLVVRTRPPGARVLIDLQSLGAVGTTPFRGPLLPGEHVVLVELEGHAPERRVVRIKPGEETVLELRLRRGSGQLEVVSSEPGAELYVDGQRTATLPAGVLQLAPGPHRLEVRKVGFVTWRRQISLAAGETVRVDVELRAVAKRRSLRPYAWATLAVSGVALATGGAFYGLALTRISSLEGARGEFGPVYRDLEQEARTYGRVAIAGLAVGGVLALGAGALFLLEPRERAERRASAEGALGRSFLGRLRRSLTAVPVASPGWLGAQATLRWP